MNSDILLSDEVRTQISDFVKLLEEYNGVLPSQIMRSSQDYKFLRNFFTEFVIDRNSRAEEVKSKEYRRVLEKAHKILPMDTQSVMCIDGRVKMIHAFGFSADIGNAIRKPGGILKEFIRGKDGQLKLDQDSIFAQQLESAISRGKFLAEIFDSHYLCAARRREEMQGGKNPKDGGLFSDVLHKKEMVGATKEYVLGKKFDIHSLFLIQTTFNPITGYMYMGLETDRAINYAKNFAKESGNGLPVYSKNVIKALVEDGLIISTGILKENKTARSMFDKYRFHISWKRDYVNSADRFWGGISEMKNILIPIFKENLISIYPELSGDDDYSKRELEERAILLLANTFNAYLHNAEHSEDEYLNIQDDEYEGQHHYEYDTHREEGVKISRGGHPVYDIAMLVIDSEDKENMAADLEFGAGIVRENRLLGRISDSSKTYKNPDEFAVAPVPVVMQEIITDSRLSGEDWEILKNIDWSGLQDLPWDSWTSTEFAQYLEMKALLPNSIANAIDRLRINMFTIFDRRSQSASHLINQLKVALPVICGPDRETHAVIPFVKLGY